MYVTDKLRPLFPYLLFSRIDETLHVNEFIIDNGDIIQSTEEVFTLDTDIVKIVCATFIYKNKNNIRVVYSPDIDIKDKKTYSPSCSFKEYKTSFILYFFRNKNDYLKYRLKL